MSVCVTATVMRGDEALGALSLVRRAAVGLAGFLLVPAVVVGVAVLSNSPTPEDGAMEQGAWAYPPQRSESQAKLGELRATIESRDSKYRVIDAGVSDSTVFPLRMYAPFRNGGSG